LILKVESLFTFRKLEDLDEVILYEAVASRNDSILHVASMSEVARVSYFENYIDTSKKKKEEKKILDETTKSKIIEIEIVPTTSINLPYQRKT
jgi:hypothetical protein